MDAVQRLVLPRSLAGLELKEAENVERGSVLTAIRTPLIHNEKYPGWNWKLSDGKQTAVVTLLMTEELDEIRDTSESAFAFTDYPSSCRPSPVRDRSMPGGAGRCANTKGSVPPAVPL